MISDDELDEIQARANAATEGPWRASWDEADRWFSITGQPNPSKGDDRMVCPEVATLNHQPWWIADAVFIAHARTDVPRLIAEIRRAKAEGWADGYIAGHEDARAVQPTYPQPTPNPYAETEQENES